MRDFAMLLATLIVFASSAAHSADIQMVAKSEDPEEFARIRLQGPITAGDAAKLKVLFDQELQDYYFDTHYVTLTLDSRGGSFAEAIRLMDMFRTLQIATRVSTGASCLSACAVAFMGGSRVVANVFSTSRTLEPGGTLGFHAPSLDVPGTAVVPAALLQSSYATALRAISGILERRDQFDIQTSLVEAMIATPPSSMYVLETVDDFARWNIAVELDQSGWQPDEADVARMCLNTAIWSSGNSISAIEESNRVQHGVPSMAERVREWAGLVRFHEPAGQQGIRSVYAYASETGLAVSTCVVQLVYFDGQWHPTVFWSDSQPELAIEAAKQSSSGDGSYMLHALPHDFRIDALR